MVCRETLLADARHSMKRATREPLAHSHKTDTPIYGLQSVAYEEPRRAMEELVQRYESELPGSLASDLVSTSGSNVERSR